MGTEIVLPKTSSFMMSGSLEDIEKFILLSTRILPIRSVIFTFLF